MTFLRMNVIPTSTFSVAALNMAENAVLEELRSQFGGLAFLSRAWLVRLLKPEEAARRPVGYPHDGRTLDQYLRKLESLKEIVRIRAQDGGAFYALRKTWDAVIPVAQDALRRTPTTARGSPTQIPILLPGPAGLTPEARDRVWVPVQSPNVPGNVLYTWGPIRSLRHHAKGVLAPETHVSVSPDVKWVGLVLSTEHARSGKIRFEQYDDSGTIRQSGFFREP